MPSGIYPTRDNLDLLRRTFDIREYGAVGDGLTNDTVAIRMAIAELNSAGGGIFLVPPGVYKTSGGFTFTAPFRAIGGGNNSYVDTTPISQINCTSPTSVLFTTTCQHGSFEQLNLTNTASTTPTAGSAILTNSTQRRSRINFDHCTFRGFYDNVDCKVNCWWTMHNCDIAKFQRYGVRVRNTAATDFGDWTINDCRLYSEDVAGEVAIRIESAGAARITGCKFNCGENLVGFGRCVYLTGGVFTSIFQLIGNSLENYSGNGVVLEGLWPSVIIMGNQWGGGSNNTPLLISNNDNVVVSNNVFATASLLAAHFDTVTNGRLWGNVIAGSIVNLLTVSGCTNILVDGVSPD